MNSIAFTTADIAKGYASFKLKSCSLEMIGVNSSVSVGYQFAGFVQTADVQSYLTNFSISSLQQFGQCTITSLYDTIKI